MRLILISTLLLLCFSVVPANAGSGGFRLKDFKRILTADSSEAKNSALAKQVLEHGVSFEYTMKRENALRAWGANDGLIGAIWQSIVDKREEAKMYRKFMDIHRSEDKEVRKTALEKGKVYLARFESNVRFQENTGKVRKEVKFLACEFDPELGC